MKTFAAIITLCLFVPAASAADLSNGLYDSFQREWSTTPSFNSLKSTSTWELQHSLDRINNSLKGLDASLRQERQAAVSARLTKKAPQIEDPYVYSCDAEKEKFDYLVQLYEKRREILPMFLKMEIIDYVAKMELAAQFIEEVWDPNIQNTIDELHSGTLCEDAEPVLEDDELPVFLPYDVPEDAWYGDALKEFTHARYFNGNEPFRPSDLATRAEFIKIIVALNGGLILTPPSSASFKDVPVESRHFDFFEEAAKEGWMTGMGNCYGRHPCYAKPDSPINRAEAAALMIRAFALKKGSQVPAFTDAAENAWYTDSIQTAASLCILQGDTTTGKVRPADSMNRAEMVMMLQRVDKGLAYPHCD